MKLSRRMAMGTLVGGAASGRQIIDKAAKQMATANFPSETKINTLMQGGVEIERELSPQEILKLRLDDYNARLKLLTKLANGDFSGLWQEESIEEATVSHKNRMKNVHLASLKSVSHAGIAQIEHSMVMDQMKKDWIEIAKKELKNLIFPTLENQNDKKVGQP